ncbi:hypothetical protein [Cohnella boryungensis]|uniref:Uncharacterized protein n=1 Tax=Cohnella boryungensis TaxID=768479 RepID=A0ABV8S7E1_9BACL
MKTINNTEIPQPRLGIQGSVVAWQDPWAGEASDTIMRTGTGRIVPSQDPAPGGGEFLEALKALGAEFYVHHVMPGLEGQSQLLADVERHDMDLCLGNEYGNINGPWVPGSNRYDIPDDALVQAAATGRLIGLLYDEPEHLQINARQYRKDDWFPHWPVADVPGSLDEARDSFTRTAAARVGHVREILQADGQDGAVSADGVEVSSGTDKAGAAHANVPVLSEQVFPVLFHAQARAGLAPCPKIMKESFQSLQLSTALGAAKQYRLPLWICADLWGPDAGAWFTRAPGFPGHSPAEFASALRMGYLMGPDRMFVENTDVLLRYNAPNGFRRTEFGDVWQQFAREFVPAHRLNWTHRDADADIVLIHSDDSNYGQNERPFGLRELRMPAETQSVFHAWHLISHGTLPCHGNNMHISGYRFPRHELKRLVEDAQFPLENGKLLPDTQPAHPLFFPTNNVLVYDGHVSEDQLGNPRLIIIAGTHLSPESLQAVINCAERGATVIACEWLLPQAWRRSTRLQDGLWLSTTSLLSDNVKEAAAPFLGKPDCWSLRFGDREVRFYPKDDAGFELNFEITS